MANGIKLSHRDIGMNIMRPAGGDYDYPISLAIFCGISPDHDVNIRVLEFAAAHDLFIAVNRNYISIDTPPEYLWHRVPTAALWLPHADIVLYRNKKYTKTDKNPRFYIPS